MDSAVTVWASAGVSSSALAGSFSSAAGTASAEDTDEGWMISGCFTSTVTGVCV